MSTGQTVAIGTGTTTFTAVCAACGTTFAGRLELDVDRAVFLCRAGHHVHVERAEPAAEATASAA
jgi:hypothetical protein